MRFPLWPAWECDSVRNNHSRWGITSYNKFCRISSQCNLYKNCVNWLRMDRVINNNKRIRFMDNRVFCALSKLLIKRSVQFSVCWICSRFNVIFKKQLNVKKGKIKQKSRLFWQNISERYFWSFLWISEEWIVCVECAMNRGAWCDPKNI